MSETNFSIPYGLRSPLEHERDTDDTSAKAIETLITQARWSNDHAAGMTLCAHEVALVIALAAERDRLRACRRERKHDMSLHKDADEAIVDFYTQFMEEEDEPLSCMVSVAGIRSIIRHRSALVAEIDALQARAERAEAALAAMKGDAE